MRNPFALLADWVDHRTGYRHSLGKALYENIPSGARWRYVTGSMLVFAFVTQVITGLALWMCYSPSSQTAWESVHYIQNVMVGGWLLRGIHQIMAQAMIVLLPLHMLQVVVDRAYTAPREFNYWCGLILMLLVLGLGLTGYLLPWDQKGYWATQVATNIMMRAPGGAYQRTLLVGGSEYGHATLTRFFALHAGVLPLLLAIVLVVHLALFRRHGIKAKIKAGRLDQRFWPHQVFKDAFACLLLLAVVILSVVNWDYRALTGNLPVEARGAELGAPADAAEQYLAARPEWYFLFLFQLLKKFESQLVGAIVVPSAILAFLFLMPFLGRWKVGHVFCVTVFVLLLAGAAYLTFEAMHDDYYSKLYADPATKESPSEEYVHRWDKSHHYLHAVEKAEVEARRLNELIAYYGIPREGALFLQRNDPETMGPRLFARHCASCHSHVDAEGNGIPVEEESTAPNLYGIGTPEWYEKVLDPERIASVEMFGNTKHKDGEMVMFVQNDLESMSDSAADRANLISALSAEAELVPRRQADALARNDGTIAKGKKALVDTFVCINCHKYHDDDPEAGAPDLTGIYSAEWLSEFIRDPNHPRFYPDDKNDRMPAFGRDDLLTDHEIDMLVRWLRGDDRDLALKFAPQPADDDKPKPAEPSAKTQPKNGDNGDAPADNSDSSDSGSTNG